MTRLYGFLFGVVVALGVYCRMVVNEWKMWRAA